ncbi:pyrroline-5-carboxylate reductase-like [Arachis stenosperma]|uniref:pyrroline-5-carboxylate reductase-like n=1 Tax=Arachis stenosperma TaxID=217475 RepID=UPI0025AC5977|nr:pyrroline-5-carboxylate reductase-like [Arachis stenosperma]
MSSGAVDAVEHVLEFVTDSLDQFGKLAEVVIAAISLLWFYPLYVFSMVLSIIWKVLQVMLEFVLKIRLSNNAVRYNDIAKFGYAAMGRSKFTGEKDSSQIMSLGAAATEEDANLIAKLFGSIGKIWKADEKYFDAVTGLREFLGMCVAIEFRPLS